MDPLYFGDPERQLFGVYNPAQARSRGAGVVVCPPLPQEYHQCLFGLRKLAENLAQEGFDVLRFDWYGTGDSGGDLRDADVSGWVRDLRRAAEELKEIAGTRRMSVVGHRLGGAIAAGAVNGGLQVRDLVLWDTPLRGTDHLRELAREQEEFRSSNNLPGGLLADELLGFRVPMALRNSIDALDLSRPATLKAERVFIFTPAPRPDQVELQRALRDRSGRESILACVAEETTQPYGTPVVASRTIRAIVTSMTGAIS